MAQKARDKTDTRLVSTSVPLAYVWPFGFVGCILFGAAEFTSHEFCDSVRVCLEAPVARWNLKPEMIATNSKSNSLVLVHSHDCHQNFEEQTRHLEIYWNQKVKYNHMNLPHKKSNPRGRDWGMQVWEKKVWWDLMSGYVKASQRQIRISR